MKTKTYLSTLIFILLAGASFAQQGGNNPFQLSGKIIDAESGDPLEYATISLLNKGDSALVGGAITDPSGSFTIKGKPGEYLLRLQFISYQTKFISDIVFDRRNLKIDLGEILMSSDAETLQEVVVSANKSQMNLELDKRVFNVGQDLANIGANASEIMDNLPSVSVDVDGNISLRGSGNVRILVNGKPSGLVGINNADGLRQLQGDLIERIEVITNPSARYDAEGSAGIINIILKKEREKGFNGSFTANTGYPANYGFSGNVNYRTGNFNLFGSYGINYRSSPGGGFTDRTVMSPDTTFFTNIDNDRNRSGLSHNFRMGSDFYINENNIITASGLVRISDEENITDIIYSDISENGVLFSNSSRKDTEIEDDDNIEYQLRYTRTMKGDGHELTAEVQYRDNDETEDSSIDSANLLTDSNVIEYQRSLNEQGDRNLLTQIDYVYPINDGKKFEAGYRGTFREISSDYIVEEIDDNDVFQPLPGFTNFFQYNEDVYAAYAIFENKMEKWGYQIGLRAEQTFIRTYQRETDQTDTKEYLNAFPSAFISYNLNNEQTVQASYSRRLSRPRFWYLNPFSSFSDPRNIRIGNTDLDPEYTDSYELGLLNNLGNTSIYVGGYYRYTTGIIDRIETSDDGIRTVSQPRNIGTENAFGIEANFNMDPTDWYNLNGNFNFYRAVTEGSFNDLVLDREAYTARFRLNNRFKVGDVDIQLSGNYRAPEATTQGSRKGVYSVDLGANMDILNNRGTINLSVRDLFNSRKWRWETESNNFREEGEFQWRARQLRFSFTYRINQKKKRGGGDRGDYDGGDGDF